MKESVVYNTKNGLFVEIPDSGVLYDEIIASCGKVPHADVVIAKQSSDGVATATTVKVTFSKNRENTVRDTPELHLSAHK